MKYSTLNPVEQQGIVNTLIERVMAGAIFCWTSSDKPMAVRAVGRGLALRSIMEPENEGELKGSNEALWRYFNGLFNNAENVLPRPIELMIQSSLGEVLRAELRKRIETVLADYDALPDNFQYKPKPEPEMRMVA